MRINISTTTPSVDCNQGSRYSFIHQLNKLFPYKPIYAISCQNHAPWDRRQSSSRVGPVTLRLEQNDDDVEGERELELELGVEVSEGPGPPCAGTPM